MDINSILSNNASGTEKNNWANVVTTGLNVFGQNKPNSPAVTTPAPNINNNYTIGLPTDLNNPANPQTMETGVSGNVSFNTSTAVQKKDNTLLYVGIGTAVVVVIVILFFTFKKK